MPTLIFIFIFLLGCIIGSFLNVVIYRFGTGKSIAKGSSICMTCSHKLRWYELIPILSFLIQGGRCRKCASGISHQYPIVEFGTGLIFALIAFHFVPVLAFSQSVYILLVTLYAFIFSLLMVISVYDIRHKIIPDTLVYAYSLISLFSIFINHTGVGPLLTWPSLMDVVSGPLFALPFALIWLISRGRAMGLGDAKLVLGIGWMLGPTQALASVIVAFWLGALTSLFIMLFTKKKMGMKTEIPFAPFLIVSTLVTFLFNLDIFTLARLFEF